MSDSHDQNAAGGTPPTEPSANPEPQADAFQGTYDTGTGENAAQSGAPEAPQQYGQPAEQGQYEQGQYEQPQYGQAQYDPSQYAQPTYDQAQQEQAAQYDQAQYDPSQYAQPTYDQQGYPQQYAAPTYDPAQVAPDQTAVAGFAPLASTTTSKSSGSSARSLLIVAAGLLPVLGAVLAYVLARWVDSSWAVFGGVGVVVAALAVAASLAPKHNALPAFLAAAVATPFLLFACYAWGLNAHTSDYLEGVASPTFGDDDRDSDSDSDSDSDADEPVLPTPGGDDEDEPADPDESSGDTVALGSAGKVMGIEGTINSAKCGLGQVANAVDNPKSWEDGQPEYLTAKPASGKQFCLLQVTWKNVSQEPVDGYSLPEFQKVTDAGGTSFSPTDDDREYSRNLTRGQGYDFDTVNPGDTIKVAQVFTVPSGTDATQANSSGYDFSSDDADKYSVTFALK